MLKFYKNPNYKCLFDYRIAVPLKNNSIILTNQEHMDEHLNEKIGIKVKRERCELCLAIFMVSWFYLTIYLTTI